MSIATPIGVVLPTADDATSRSSAAITTETKMSSSTTSSLASVYGVRTISGQGGDEGSFMDGKVADAAFSEPQGIVTDDIGNVYVSDWDNHRIRRIGVDGIVSTLAGNGIRELKDGRGESASFDGPAGLCYNRADNHLYAADSFNCAIRKISLTDGTVSTISGNGESGMMDGNITTARWSSPCGITCDLHGNIYVTDLNRIRKISVKGEVSLVAGGSTFGKVDGIAAAASFSSPAGICMDKNGTALLVADNLNHRIRRVDITTGATTTIAGSTEGYNDGGVTDALFRGPSCVAVHPSGALIICEQLGSRIRAIVNENVITLAGSSQGDHDDIGTNAAFQHPWAVAVHQLRNDKSSVESHIIYVSDNANHRIKALIPLIQDDTK